VLKDAIEAERAERDQEADCARINAAIGLAEQDIAALETRQIDPDEMREKWSAIRDRTILAIRAVRRNVIERAIKAKQTERWMIEKSIREERDGRVTREFSAELKKVPTKDLLDYLRYLIKIGDRARIKSICIVFEAREDRQAYDVAFGKMLAQFALAEYGNVGERLTRICRLAENVDARIANLFAAYSVTNCSRALTPPKYAPIKPPRLDVSACDAIGDSNHSHDLV
jgi:hypothetical protein